MACYISKVFLFHLFFADFLYFNQTKLIVKEWLMINVTNHSFIVNFVLFTCILNLIIFEDQVNTNNFS